MRKLNRTGLSWKRLVALSACGATAVAGCVVATVARSATVDAAAYETASSNAGSRAIDGKA